MDIEIRHLRYFIAVAEELHFGRAARRLNMTQPPLSRQIRELENMLGVPLLKRTHHRVELLYAGKVFLEQARKIIREVEETVHRTHRAHRCETGWLEIGFCRQASLLLPMLLKRLRKHNPRIRISAQEMDSHEQLALLKSEQIDLAFVEESEDLPEITFCPLSRDPFMAVLPEDHELARKQFLTAQDLQHETVLLLHRKKAPRWHEQIIRFFQDTEDVPAFSEAASGIDSLLSMISAGLGVSLLPSSMQTWTHKGIRWIPLHGDMPVQTLAVAWRSKDPSGLIQAFRKILEEWLQERK